MQAVGSYKIRNAWAVLQPRREQCPALLAPDCDPNHLCCVASNAYGPAAWGLSLRSHSNTGMCHSKKNRRTLTRATVTHKQQNAFSA